MTDCKPMSTPLEAKTKTSLTDIPLEDPSHFRGLVRSLQYLTLTQPDLSYSVNYVSQFMHAPAITHLKMVRRILQYVKGTLNTGLHFSTNTSHDLSAFSDVDWAGCLTTRRSTTGYCVLWVKTSFPGAQRSNIQYRILALKSNIVQWPIQQVSLHG